jgi:hypothetical protein
VGVALIASLAPLFLGKKPSNHAGITTLTADSYNFVSSGKENDQTKDAVTGASQAILAGEKLLTEAGASLSKTVTGLDLGTRDLTHIYLSTGEQIRSAVGDPAAAAEAALQAVLKTATFSNQAEKKMVDSMIAAGKGFDDISTSLKAFEAAQSISDGITAQIKKITDPLGASVDAVNADIKAQRDAAKAAADAGYITADVLSTINGQLDELASKEITKLYQQSIEDAQASLTDAYNAQADSLNGTISTLKSFNASLKNLKQSLTSGSNAYLSPEDQYNATKAAYQSALNDVQAHPENATAQDNFTSAAQAFISASRDYFASSSGFSNDKDAVTKAVDSLSSKTSTQIDSDQKQLDLMTKQYDTLLNINSSVLSFADAVSKLANSISAQKTVSGGSADSFNADSYLKSNSDVAQSYSSGWLGTLGFKTAEEAASFHYKNYGAAEGRKPYAAGGLMTRPIALGDSGIGGEAGPEGILPLTNVGGKMGVHATLGGDDETKQLISRLVERMSKNVEVSADGHSQTIKLLNELLSTMEGIERKAALK